MDTTGNAERSKGHASYYSLKNGADNAVWTYEIPYDEMKAIQERLAFYPDEIDSIAAADPMKER